MLDPVWKRWALAAGLALVIALGITALLSRPAGQTKQKRADAVARWKAKTGVDLAALPRLYPQRPDSESALQLDAILQPAGLQLRSQKSRRPQEHPDAETLHALREALRAEMRFDTPQVTPLPPPVVSLIDRLAPVLDAAASHVESHDDIRWYEDFGPRPRESTLWIDDHLSAHRLLIGRAYLALERGDLDTARQMLSTSRRLNRLLAGRQERMSQFIAVGVERLQLALLRRGGNALGATVEAPLHQLRERFLAAMSSEAAVVLANSSGNPFGAEDPAESAVRAVAGGSLENAASEALIEVAGGVAEIVAAPDPCAELSKRRRPRGGFFGDFYSLNATATWRRFVVLSLDRAITTAALTGRASSPCASVQIAVREHGTTRTVEASGLPSPAEDEIGLPRQVSVPLP